jgi:hypothetical protein
MDIEDSGEIDGRRYVARLHFEDDLTISLRLCISGSEYIQAGFGPGVGSVEWAELEFRKQYQPRLTNQLSVLHQVRAWEREQPLYLHFVADG